MGCRLQVRRTSGVAQLTVATRTTRGTSTLLVMSTTRTPAGRTASPQFGYFREIYQGSHSDPILKRNMQRAECPAQAKQY